MIGFRSGNIIHVLKRTLDLVDYRLVSHGERVSFIVYQMLNYKGVDPQEIKDICILALLHDIGAYKTDEVTNMMEFESKDSWNHAVYGALFLKLWIPNPAYADIVLYHHMPYHILRTTSCVYQEYANLLHFADRVDIYLQHYDTIDESFYDRLGTKTFMPELISLFRLVDQEFQITQSLKNRDYSKVMKHFIDEIVLSEKEINQYLHLLAYTIDFRSEFTVAHTMIVVEIAQEIAKLMQLPCEMVEKIRIGTLLHDIGKMSTPIAILEKTSQLTPEEMKIMKHHVVMTRVILEQYLEEDVCRIACRHHEKLNGKGYPQELLEEELTIPEMIVAVADIASALAAKRSYKEAFPKAANIEILRSMARNNEINADIVELLVENYEQVFSDANENAQVLMQAYEQLKLQYITNSEEYIALLQREKGSI